MVRWLVWPVLVRLLAAQDPVLESGDDVIERKITELVIDERPLMILGELELRRLEPYFVKQAWNWQQLYDVLCTRNPHPGSCTQSLTRWFFYPTFGKCYAFLYGGCGGTTNRFRSERDCLRRCVPRQRPMRPPPAPEEPTLAPPPETPQLNALLALRDNETEAEVQRLAEPATVPSVPPPGSGPPEVSPSPSPPPESARTDKPKAKREFPSGGEQQMGLSQDVFHLDRIILR